MKCLNEMFPYRSTARYAVDHLPGQRAVEGKIVVLHDYDKYWAKGKGEDFLSDILENPTWADLFCCAENAILTTRDFHHVFFKGISEIHEGSLMVFETARKIAFPKDVKVFRLSFGS